MKVVITAALVCPYIARVLSWGLCLVRARKLGRWACGQLAPAPLLPLDYSPTFVPIIVPAPTLGSPPTHSPTTLKGEGDGQPSRQQLLDQHRPAVEATPVH